ncbi:MAG TPA: vitamin B12-dependent ribonucleotide reductase [bacterium]|nr:MAG: Vitamin B12-dependent ribonucleotide reductase [Parcubacteria group bacterium ADurb.Bin192]HPN14937.1 vitamin B12-dependent ribonucleotide reductase [bacterium]
MSPQVSSSINQKTERLTETGINTDAILAYLKTLKSIRRRDGRVDKFQPEKIRSSLREAFRSSGFTPEKEEKTINRLLSYVLHRLKLRFDGHTVPTTENVREMVSAALIDLNYTQVARNYLIYRLQLSLRSDEPHYGAGIKFQRFFSTEGRSPYDELEWDERDAVITNEKGQVVFEQKNVEVPKTYSQTATNIIVSKYFRGRLGTPERETSMRQLVDRVAKTISNWGRVGGYFMTEQDADVYEAELTSILVNQRAAFNSPVWFNVGVSSHPQCSACFINSVQDDMRSILQLSVTEGMLFKYGSGTGSNLSSLRSSKENLGNSSGKSSGPVSFMRGYDSFAGVIKSGGKTRRAAKMVILNIDHPDVQEFVWCKSKEEKKAHTLIEAGYDGSLNGEAYTSIFFQNANNSVRVSDAFMQAVERDEDFWTKYVTNGEPCEKFKARNLLREISEAAWQCGDPGMQYDGTINNWHTCSNTDRIHASNPCSEYMFLNDSACNLASVNLMKCRTKDGVFDVEAYEHVCKVMATAQEIIVGFSSYPTPAIEHNSHAYRPLGLGYANLGALLMSMGLPYDSDEGRNMAGALTSIMSGVGYNQSAVMAEKLGPFEGYEPNREPMMNIMRKHREAAYSIPAQGVPHQVWERARSCWDETIALGEQNGFRNAQISVLAPTGTIAFLMDCDTTGVEPDIALVKYKWLVGGGMIKIVNQTVPEALRHLQYTEQQTRDIIDWIDKNDTIEGAPHLQEEHLPVFDCAFKAAKGTRSINYMGHLRMMGAVQPFLSGAISKTVNMPHDSTVEDVMTVYLEGWRMGLKAVAIYRDGCKRSQPLTTSKASDTKSSQTTAVSTPAPVKTETVPLPVLNVKQAYTPRRRRLPDERRSITHKFQIGPHKGFITVGLYDDGTPGELFVTMSKEGSVLSGLLDVFSTSVSIGLQYGVPLKILVNKFAHVRFEPSGFTANPNIRVAKSIIDYIFRWLGLKFLTPEERRAIGINVDTSATAELQIEDIPKDQSLNVTGDSAQASLLEASQSKNTTLTATFDNQSDAPACDTCGSIMVRNGACYKCLNCGATSGCS